VPSEYNPAPPSEQPDIVLSFDGAVDPVSPRKVLGPKDYRPERILLDKASAGLKVRVIIPSQDFTHVSSAGAVVIELVLFFLVIGYVLFSPLVNGWKQLKKYLAAASSTADEEAFKVTLFNVVHAKLVMVDDNEAIVIGSPFNQSYWDTHDHHIYDPRRGSASGEPVPVHDVSLAVRGPAVQDMHDTFRLHWNTAAPGSAVAAIPVAAPIAARAAGEDAIASLQLVRTLNGSAFPAPLDKGERGILEAYLRAIEQAQKYIYLENQYFTNETIAKALVRALRGHHLPGGDFHLNV